MAAPPSRHGRVEVVQDELRGAIGNGMTCIAVLSGTTTKWADNERLVR